MPQPLPNPAVPFDILYEDARVLVAAKPAGVVTEPGLGHATDSLMNGLFTRFAAPLGRLGDERDHGLLHRLDRDTTGAVIVALDAAAYDHLRAQFEKRTVAKRYLALVEGRPRPAVGQVALPLEEVRRGDMKVSAIGRNGAGERALTRYRTLGGGHGRSLLEIDLDTGRLHQIRVHLAHIGCPVVDDRVYRVDLPPKTSRPPRGAMVPPLALHAWQVAFDHPGSGKRVTVTVPLPPHFTALLRKAEIALPQVPLER